MEFIEKMGGVIAEWKEEDHTVLATDAATLRDSPTSRRGFRRQVWKYMVSTNHSKSIHLMGALGAGTLDMQFHKDLKAGSYIDLVGYARQRHKIGSITGNTRALTGKTVRDYVTGTGDAVEIVHIPPHTPQLNPIEIQVGEIRSAITDIFGGLDKMQDAIACMFRNKEPIVKLFEWLLPTWAALQPKCQQYASGRHTARTIPRILLTATPHLERFASNSRAAVDPACCDGLAAPPC